MTASEGSEFQYFISEKNEYLVVVFVGPMDSKSSSLLEELSQKIAEIKAKYVVINFRDVNLISPAIIPKLTQIQKIIRGKPAELRLCGIIPEIKDRLASRGIIRSLEVIGNLHDALQSFGKLGKKSA